MTNQPRSFDFDLEQECIAITVSGRSQQLEPVARGLSLGPKLVARAAEKRHIARSERALASLAIHKAEHQHFARVSILHNGRRQALHLFKIDFAVHNSCPCRRKKRFKTKPVKTKSPLS